MKLEQQKRELDEEEVGAGAAGEAGERRAPEALHRRVVRRLPLRVGVDAEDGRAGQELPAQDEVHVDGAVAEVGRVVARDLRRAEGAEGQLRALAAGDGGDGVLEVAAGEEELRVGLQRQRRREVYVPRKVTSNSRESRSAKK